MLKFSVIFFLALLEIISLNFLFCILIIAFKSSSGEETLTIIPPLFSGWSPKSSHAPSVFVDITGNPNIIASPIINPNGSFIDGIQKTLDPLKISADDEAHLQIDKLVSKTKKSNCVKDDNGNGDKNINITKNNEFVNFE